jgi:glycosyltransferase involved in cell wall biosynthesis
LQPDTVSNRRSWRRIEDSAFEQADGILVTSQFSKNEILKRGFVSKPILVVSPAPAVVARRKLNMETRVEPRSTRQISRHRMFFGLMVSNLVRGKGVLEFLKKLERYLGPNLSFSLTIVGSNDLEPEYATACHRFVMESSVLKGNVRFAGKTGLGELRKHYERNNFFISASLMETFGMALQEARLSGLYLLVLDAGNAALHVRSNLDGRIFSSTARLAQRTAEIIRNPVDCEKLPRLIAEAHEQPTWEKAAESFLTQL